MGRLRERVRLHETQDERGQFSQNVNFTIQQEIIKLLDYSITSYESPHNVSHAWKVYENAVDIIKECGELEEVDYELLMYASLLHDVSDDFYSTFTINKEKL